MRSMAMFLTSFLLAFMFCFVAITAQNLPDDEVESLKQIVNTLGKKDWNFEVRPCSKEWDRAYDFDFSDDLSTSAASVGCDCSFANNTVCHIASISFRRQNLRGSLPPELVRLPFLQVFDVARNYLNGTIPPEWGSMKLVNISLLGNRVTGPIPKELANISTLRTLMLEFNQLSGTIPPELGNLPSIERLLLTSNNLTGELPENLSNLTTLKDFRIGDNNFVGSIPNFIQKWTNMNKLMIQGSGLSGPIPAGIASLTNLTDLRISDLNGDDSAFPPLNETIKLKRLILRSCNITGHLPSYIGNLTSLKDLDLSFNKLSGHIPDDFGGLSRTDYIFLTGNSLTGPIPSWMKNSRSKIDLSYNNFTYENLESYCRLPNLNLFASSKEKRHGVDLCLKSRCPSRNSSFHINCGGVSQVVDNIIYESDTNSGGPANFFQGGTNWAFSSTGDFLDDNDPSSSTIATSSWQNSQLYRDARISSLSLTYYGFCLINGKYIVKLHFAEIMFDDDRTFSSLGRRVFDIYVQGERVLRDFNIEEEADDVNKAVIRNFSAVVTDGTLDIRFYWAGKGTTAIPFRGVYGPLISAISVDYVFEPTNGISTGAIVGIVLGVLLTVLLVLGILWRKGWLTRKGSAEHVSKEAELPFFNLSTILKATDHFSINNKLGEGGFGPVYRGMLEDGQEIAVKRLSKTSSQGVDQLKNEVILIAELQHRNLVRLLGCCIEREENMLIYEFLHNSSLDLILFDQTKSMFLDWQKRFHIINGIAKGLLYLHQDSRLRIIHRDIKASNILLDADMNPKISDFGLARTFGGNETEARTHRVVGTYGYMSPEYAIDGLFSVKSDVFSFGVLVLEIVSGKINRGFSTKDHNLNLLGHAWTLYKEDNSRELVDASLGESFDLSQVLRSIHVGLLCVQKHPEDRPSMSSVVFMLGNEVELPQAKQPGFFTERDVNAAESSTRTNTASTKNEVSITLLEGR